MASGLHFPIPNGQVSRAVIEHDAVGDGRLFPLPGSPGAAGVRDRMQSVFSKGDFGKRNREPRRSLLAFDMRWQYDSPNL
jgi:hypothetical protein